MNEASKGKINVKDATIAAQQCFFDIVGSTPRGVTVEEVEFYEEDGKKFWAITLGYDQFTSYAIPYQQRAYKEFKIDAETGEVLGMKIRKF